MRDKKRKERKLLEDAYTEVHNEMNLGPAAQTASGALGSLGPIIVGVQEDPLAAFEGEECGSHVVPDIDALAAQAIAAITELATAAGANIAVTVETQQEEVDEVDVDIDQFNTGYEDVEDT